MNKFFKKLETILHTMQSGEGNDTGKSITFTADAEFPVGTTFILVLEENV